MWSSSMGQRYSKDVLLLRRMILALSWTPELKVQRKGSGVHWMLGE